MKKTFSEFKIFRKSEIYNLFTPEAEVLMSEEKFHKLDRIGTYYEFDVEFSFP